MRFSCVWMFVLVAACSAERGAGPSAARIGVERVEISESATDRTIAGLDGDGREIAKLTIHHGTVVMPDDDRTVWGHELLVTLGGEMSLRYVNEGVLTSTTLPFLDPEGAGDRERFLGDERVAAALARWGVTFADRARSLSGDGAGETAYNACTNTRCTGSGNYELECCQYDDWQYVTCNTLGRGVLNERGCGNVPTCSGGGAYGASGCPAGQSAICGNGNFQNPSNPRLCMADACTDKAVGAAGCAVCAQTSSSYGYWWSIVDAGSCSTVECVQNGFSGNGSCCSGFNTDYFGCQPAPTAQSCEALGSDVCLATCHGRGYGVWQECWACGDSGYITGCAALDRPLPPETFCGDSVCAGFEPSECPSDCPQGYDCESGELEACFASLCPGGCNGYLEGLCYFITACPPPP